jgi:hypothetical protein
VNLEKTNLNGGEIKRADSSRAESPLGMTEINGLSARAKLVPFPVSVDIRVLPQPD